MRHRLTVRVLILGVFIAWAATIAGAQEPSEREVLLLGARNAWRLGAYEQAITRYRSAIALAPTQWDAITELGWLLLEAERRFEALAQFEAAATLAPDDLTVWRNKAGAYGWTFQHERALAEFDAILKRFPDDVATVLERDGKASLWLGRLRRAKTAFELLAELEPQNSEALFDLGQIATLGGRPSEAQAAYRQLMSVVPGHRQAELALDLSELSQRPLLTLGYNYIDQKGFDDKRSIRYGLASAEGRVRMSDDVSARVRYENVQFHFGRKHLLTNVGTVGLRYSPNGYFHMDGFVSEIHYNEIGRDRLNVGVGVSYEMPSGTRVRVDFERKDLWENQTTVLNGITVNRLSASVSGALERRVDWAIQGNYANYSDNNTRVGGEFLASYRLLWFPKAFRLIYRVNAYGFQRERSYFSPGAYATNTVAVEFQRWLGYPTKEDYLAEAPRNHYTAYYGISMDSNGKLFHEWQGKLAYALARQLDVGLSLKAIRSSVYDEWNAGVLIDYRF
ncbi:hypothetical protein CLG94_10550 [Candidatus Methylomirabilis limnetica]|uniref:Uncharacterized protein n=1 Tax=Candidatus Methylomirabilis limnetica TaxID=2033718 RepID=A0A2T4TVY1_9BACT|nr:tetratricopeptide repeat protein [Candidatus Methylomirabilis limnetica]PTL35265.1 hypothetical protein CLG94_10550 [Candidatus Methylomirabilis limnetica]